jgi:hypothetical protein
VLFRTQSLPHAALMGATIFGPLNLSLAGSGPLL